MFEGYRPIYQQVWDTLANTAAVFSGFGSEAWRREGKWFIHSQETTKPFQRFRIEASLGLQRGLAGVLSRFDWRKRTCHIHGIGMRSEVEFKEGASGEKNRIECRVQFDSLSPASFPFFRDKILADVVNLTDEVSGRSHSATKRVFIAHGTDPESATPALSQEAEDLASILRRVDIEPVLLIEQDSIGSMTIIEKFEYYASTCAFAFVLMTPDQRVRVNDRGAERTGPTVNVVMELGWFMAHLGRDCVGIVADHEVFIPSQISGVLVSEYVDRVEEAEDEILNTLNRAGLIASTVPNLQTAP